MGALFGTDGVRGKYGKELTDDMARLLGYYGTKVLTESHSPTIIIGTDTRESADNLTNALADGITSAGGKVLLAGVVPTPAVAVLVRELGADAGIVVSASHNLYEDNGIKFFNSKGFKLPDETEDVITKLFYEDKDHVQKKDSFETEIIEDPEKIYLDFINEEKHNRLDGLKIVLDCSNGALYQIAPDYFESLGAEVIPIGKHPNGKNINLNCGSTDTKYICKKVKEVGADFGFAFDGDADRCLAIDENGEVIDGDRIMNLIGRKMKEEGTLNDNMIVVTQMSNYGLPIALEQAGLQCIRTDVGDRYVLEKMLENNYTLGGEQSGHVIKLDHNTTGDGLLTASLLADIFSTSDKKPSELSHLMKVYPQTLKNAYVENSKKNDYLNDEEIVNRIEELKEIIGEKGRVYIRPSGTEPKIRVMLEGTNQEQINKLAKDTVKLIESKLN